MTEFLSLISADPAVSVARILEQNTYLATHGLCLTAAEATSIAEHHATALRENGLIDLGGGVTARLIAVFADSPYADASNFAELIEAMSEAFCYLKREATCECSDSAVIDAMRRFFDGVSQGSIDLFLGREMETLLRYLRRGGKGEDGQPDYRIREEGSKPDTSY